MTSLKTPVQEPAARIEAAEEPPAGAVGGFGDVVVAADVVAAPPAGLDALGANAACHGLHVAGVPERFRFAIGHDRDHIDGDRPGVEPQRAICLRCFRWRFGWVQC